MFSVFSDNTILQQIKDKNTSSILCRDSNPQPLDHNRGNENELIRQRDKIFGQFKQSREMERTKPR